MMCGTAPLDEVSAQDAALLKAAEEKHLKKASSVKQKGGGNKLTKSVSTPEPTVLSFAALSSFKMSKKRRIALSARSGLKDNRPKNPDSNIWAGLLRRRRGYAYRARVLSRILALFRRRGSSSYEGPTDGANVQCSGLYQKGLWALFAAERENSYYTI